MKVLQSRCDGCGECLTICPTDAIGFRENTIFVDRDQCVECGVCWRTTVCPHGVFAQEALVWPRVLRAMFSDPATEHRRTGLAGRGLEAEKTNDVRHTYTGDIVAVAAEIGRPGLGASFQDVQRITRAMAECGARFTVENPLSDLFIEPDRGLLHPEILGERILSIIVECLVRKIDLKRTLQSVFDAAAGLDAPVLISLAGAYADDGTLPYESVLKEMGLSCVPTGKVNLGFGQ